MAVKNSRQYIGNMHDNKLSGGGVMREILFRGKPVEAVHDDYAGETLFAECDFVYGNLVFDGEQPVIVGKIVDRDPDYIHMEWWVCVRPETVGQNTGMKDQNGVEIYEGDILLSPLTGKFYHVRHRRGCFVLMDEEGLLFKNGLYVGEYEIIGNIHDNHELFGVE